MNISAFLKKQKTVVIKFIQLQLFITLISLPILLWWGLPLSILTFIGNFIFSPFLTCFLLLSSLIFFCEILHIPNSIFIFCLEKLTHWWLTIMHYGSAQHLIALPKPSFLFSILIVIGSGMILHHKKINTPSRSIICYGLFLIGICLYLKYDAISSSPTLEHLEYNKGMLTIINHEGKITLIDPGVVGKRISASSWCEYTLIPHLAKKYGSLTLDHFIALQFNGILFKALSLLMEKITIKKIYLPLWEGRIPPHWWQAYVQLKNSCFKKGCLLIRFGKQPITIPLSTEDKLTITPLLSSITGNDFSYPHFQVSGLIDNQKVALYSAKYTQKELIKKDTYGTS